MASPVSGSCRAMYSSCRCSRTRTRVWDACRPSARCSSKNRSSNSRRRAKKQTRIPRRAPSLIKRRDAERFQARLPKTRRQRREFRLRLVGMDDDLDGRVAERVDGRDDLGERVRAGDELKDARLVPQHDGGLRGGGRVAGDLREGLRDVFIADADAEGAGDVLQDAHPLFGGLGRSARAQQFALVLQSLGGVEDGDAHDRRVLVAR